ncbi:putative exosome subunit rrp6p [Leptomonas pyrrhocoris]|uniref:Putative exosome subunit rrp6p n=1 Tax=Leptomonas pyrrhocoris TaxID=157538 RepID=A0A0N0DX09_LEPPY|nr:putative exosome subunit rrp6p [Leptomonas pyrrhocoris]KPA82392.1 putative exosome subunit rrp6p [Leptomonas pyrrhocoris]|eukprot:XP_015660831.1 putative exosome subunit rrp6p [Leptomonas pyrrhocoris]
MPPKSCDASLPATKAVVSAVFGAVKEYSKLSAQIPSDDYDYHLAFPGFRKHIRDDSETLISLMDACCQMLPKRRRTSLVSEEDPHSGAVHLAETQRNAVMEAIDSLLENVDSLLDEVKGRKLDAQEQLSVSFGSELAASSHQDGGRAAAANGQGGVVRLAHVRRPQLSFETVVDNSTAPFIPTYVAADGVRHTGVAGVHPFEDIIKAFAVPQHQLLPKSEIPPVPLETCPLSFVDAPEAMQAMVQKLLAASEIAVDLEHHDFYSYQGFTCLMQISTREEDFIVDCLQLRSAMSALAPVFLNPAILKVLHGAREDVRWLQKDFSLYLVNFFDTGVALQTLHMPYSLAFAVDHFCQVKLNKKYQTADWRVRPLPADMVHYARQDTHFLLYVYDRLKALLLNSEGRASIGNLLVHVYSESKQLSLQVYAKPNVDPAETYKLALGRSLGGLTAVQEQVARDIFNWRESAAREADDSPTAVLHLSSVLAIASKLPTTAKDLLRCCSPATAVLRENVGHLVSLVKKAVADDVDGGTSAKHGKDGEHANVHVDDAAEGSREWNFYRARCPTGVYRPMTGTLPSLASVVKMVAPADASESERATLLSNTVPSPWFTAMKALSRVLASRPPHHVELPGADVLAVRQAAAAATKTNPIDAATEPEEGETDMHENEDQADRSSASSEAVEQRDEVNEEALMPAYTPETSSAIPVDKRAFSIKQKYGVGAKARPKKGGRGGAAKKK